MTFTLSLLIGMFQTVMVLSYGRISPDSGSFLGLVRLFIILLSYALIPLYWIYKNEDMKKYAKNLIPCL